MHFVAVHTVLLFCRESISDVNSTLQESHQQRSTRLMRLQDQEFYFVDAVDEWNRFPNAFCSCAHRFVIL